MQRSAHFFQSAFQEKRLRLLTQPIVSIPDTANPQHISRAEVLTCIWDESAPVPQRVFACEWINAICRSPEAMQALDLNTLLGVLARPRQGQFWVNLSALSLADPWFVDGAIAAILVSGWEPSQLVFEITEHCPITPAVVKACHSLRAIGCGLALDDFGAGYAAACHLVELPLTALKIAAELCQQAAHNVKAYQVLEAFIKMAQGMDLEVVAEGVETSEQRQLLSHLGCSLFQGFLFGPREPLWECSAQNPYPLG